jgi:hypothetical protein
MYRPKQSEERLDVSNGLVEHLGSLQVWLEIAAEYLLPSPLDTQHHEESAKIQINETLLHSNPLTGSSVEVC